MLSCEFSLGIGFKQSAWFAGNTALKRVRLIALFLLLALGFDTLAITCEPKNASTGSFAVSVSRARYYKPELWRFWTRDTDEGSLLKPSSLHKYLYCNADPVNGSDPTGLRTFLVMYGEDSTDLFEQSAKWYQERIKTFEVFVPGRDEIVVEKVYTVSKMAKVLRDNKDIQYVVYIGHGGWGVLYLGMPSGKDYNLSEKGGPAGDASESTPIKELPKDNIRSDARIDLISCYSRVSETGGTSMAQAFANYFNVPVQGSVSVNADLKKAISYQSL